jgi:glyoxylase-like metal-dependent hydrolase (beta-lactamase superfamily II)
MKPQIYILQFGKVENLINPTLEGAKGVLVTTGLIVYEKNNIKKGMIIDPGIVSSFYGYQDQLSQYGLELKDITHLLVTHCHQDHLQSLAKFNDGTHIFHYGNSAILGSNKFNGLVYDKFIEIPEITFALLDNAHTKKDTIFIIDSANEGKVAFMGDIITADAETISLENQSNMDKTSSTNPERRYNLGKQFFESNQDITGFYLGHASRKLSREGIDNYYKNFKVAE